MDWLRRYNKQILIFTFGMFILGGVVFSGLSGAMDLGPTSTVLVVGDRKVPYKDYQNRLDLMAARMDRGEPMTPEKRQALKNNALQDLIQETAFSIEAERYGIETTDAELASYLQNAPAFQREGRFDPSLYSQALAQWRTTPARFEEEQRGFIRRHKLMTVLGSGIKVSRDEAARFLARNASRLPADKKKELSASFDALRDAAAQPQGNAAMQIWLTQLSGRLKVENRLDRWEKRG